MTIASVKKVRGLFNNTPVDFAFTGNVTQDNYIIVSAAIYLGTGASPALGITTKAGSTATLGSWTQAKSAELAVIADRVVATIYHAKVTGTGTLTLQLSETVAGGCGGTAVAVEYSGIDLTTPLDGTTSQATNTGSPTVQTCGSISPTTAGMICGISTDYATTGIVSRSAITDVEDDREDNSANVTYFAQHKITTTGGTYELANTVAVGMEYVGVSVAYRAAGGDTAPPTVTTFTIPAHSDSPTFAITTLTATDAVGVTGWQITESSTPPTTTGWITTGITGTTSATITGTFTTATATTHDVYAWVCDAAGLVSAVYTAQSVAFTAAPTGDFWGGQFWGGGFWSATGTQTVTAYSGGGSVTGGMSGTTASRETVVSGGAVVSGLASTTKSVVALVDGGAVSGGYSSVSFGVTAYCNGGAVTGGASVVTASATPYVSGGSVTAGISSTTVAISSTVSGGAVTAGISDVTGSYAGGGTQTVTAYTFGGAVVSGTSGVTAAINSVSTGGSVTGGRFDISATANTVMIGGVVAGGSSPVSTGITSVMIGGAVTSGTSSVTRSVSVSSNGGIVSGGVAVLSAQVGLAMSGGCVTGGKSLVTTYTGGQTPYDPTRLKVILNPFSGKLQYVYV